VNLNKDETMKAINVYHDAKNHRKAIINEDNSKYYVDLYYDNNKHRTVDVSAHSLRYAEDVAENWTSGLIRD
jgi:hypothetical protein